MRHRVVIDGFDVRLVGGRGVELVQVTTPKGYRRRKPTTVRLDGAAGMFAGQLKSGSIVCGQRVIGMRRGMLGGRPTVAVQLADRSWTVPLFLDERVPGTVRRTDLPAGPVGAGRGQRASRVGRQDGESARDRHARFIDGITYGGR